MHKFSFETKFNVGDDVFVVDVEKSVIKKYYVSGIEFCSYHGDGNYITYLFKEAHKSPAEKDSLSLSQKEAESTFGLTKEEAIFKITEKIKTFKVEK